MSNKAIPYILLATLAFAVMNALAKELSTFHPLQVVFFRAIGSFVFILPFMLWNRISLVGNNPGRLMLRAVIGFISLATFFIAIQRIPLGSAISIRYLGPIFGAALAYYFLKERIRPIQWLSFAIAFSGVVVLKGFDLRIDATSLALVVTSAVLVGGVFVLLRFLSQREHYMTIINYFMVVSILGSLFFVGEWRWPVSVEWWSVIGIGTTGLIGQIFMTRAFGLAETSLLAPFKYMELVYALIIGYFIFGETYSWVPFTGILLILGGMLLNTYKPRTGVKKRTTAKV